MYKFTVMMADTIFAVKNLYSYTMKMCADYICESGMDVGITTNDDDIEFERRKSLEEADAQGIPAVEYGAGYLESLAVYRKAATAIPYRGGVLVHGALIAVDGEGYLFMAPSGTGKTTHVKLWLEKFGDRAEIINGDKPILRFVGDKLMGYGTPWCGKEGFNKNASVPVKAVCVLRRGITNHIEDIGEGEAFASIMPYVFKPEGAGEMELTLDLIDRITGAVRLTRLSCNMDKEAADVAYEGMKN
ncbi:MAG: hypothetical protein K6F92_04395 [Lachnospiraceae bacterium]|nr:hypothetical protein [Lachnospiraceae bacterium]